MSKSPQIPTLVPEILMEDHESLDNFMYLTDAIKKITEEKEKELQKLVEQLGIDESNAHEYYLEDHYDFKDNHCFIRMELKRKDGRPIEFKYKEELL